MKWTSRGPRAQMRSTGSGSPPSHGNRGEKGGTAISMASGLTAPVLCWLSPGPVIATTRRSHMELTLWERIERAHERWNVLRHPFYVRWTEGELTAEELARYSGQYRHAVEAIARTSSEAADAAPGRSEL